MTLRRKVQLYGTWFFVAAGLALAIQASVYWNDRRIERDRASNPTPHAFTCNREMPSNAGLAWVERFCNVTVVASKDDVKFLPTSTPRSYYYICNKSAFINGDDMPINADLSWLDVFCTRHLDVQN
jgi:hypothetical protein